MGAFSQKGALPPLISFGLSEDQHFCRALTVSSERLPTEIPPLVEPDLAFVAYKMCNRREELGHLRNQAVNAVYVLKSRWRPVISRRRTI